jgi:hypothetical protein
MKGDTMNIKHYWYNTFTIQNDNRTIERIKGRAMEFILKEVE